MSITASPALNGTHLLDGLNAVVTGGAQGLGFGCSRWLASAGARVFIADKNAEAAKRSAESLRGKNHQGIFCDVRSADDRRNLIKGIWEEAGSIDILINNAGITYISPAEEMDEDQWRAVFEVNIHAMMLMSRDVGKRMIQRGSGSIINIGSITSLLAMPGRAAYVTTKTAVLGLTRTLAIEWASRGVRVNAIGPGYHRTPLLEKYTEQGLIDEERIRSRIPMDRLGTIDDIGKAAVFFASPLSTYVTGQFLMVDGGYTVFGAPEDAS
jgi:NAD(P)-dependent dehydrogenase (short-subunit alcohol dehydrogenase family)